MRGWFAVFGPAGTPKAVIDKLATEIATMQVTSQIKEKLASQALDPLICAPDRLAALMKADIATNTKIIKTASIKLE